MVNSLVLSLSSSVFVGRFANTTDRSSTLVSNSDVSHILQTALMIVVTLGLVFARLWLTAIFALAVNSVTSCRHSCKNQNVQNLRVLGNLETEHASLNVIVLNLPQRVYENGPPLLIPQTCGVGSVDLLGGRLGHFSCRCRSVLVHFQICPSVLWTRALHCPISEILDLTPLLPNTSAAENWICPNTSSTALVGSTWSPPVASAIVRPVWCNRSLSHGLCQYASLFWFHRRFHTEHSHACRFESFDVRRPGILVLSKIVLNLRSATGASLSRKSCVTQFLYRLE